MTNGHIYSGSVAFCFRGAILSVGLESVFDESQSQPGLGAGPVCTFSLKRGPPEMPKGQPRAKFYKVVKEILKTLQNREATALV